MAEKLNRFERYLSSNLGYGSSSFSFKELLIFNEKLYGQLSTKRTLPDALDAVFETTGNRVHRMVLFSIANSVKSGTPLSQAMLTFKDIFPNFFIAMIMATERSGKFLAGLEAMGLHLQNENKMFDYFNVSMFYLRMLIYVVIGFLFYFIYKLHLIEFTVNNVLILTAVLAILALIVGAIGRYLHKNSLKKEKILSLIPLAGKIHFLKSISSFCFLYNVFHRSGVPIHQIRGLIKNYIGPSRLTKDIDLLNKWIKSKPDPNRIPKTLQVIPETLAREILLFEQNKTKFDTIRNYSQFVGAEIEDIAETILNLEKRILLGIVALGAIVIYLSVIY